MRKFCEKITEIDVIASVAKQSTIEENLTIYFFFINIQYNYVSKQISRRTANA